MVHFVGAGPGAEDLITLRGARLLGKADVLIYAGSLVNPVLLGLCREDCRICNSAQMTLEQTIDVMLRAEAEGKTTVRLHTGDPAIFGAIREQMELLKIYNIEYDITPGVSSFCGAAAALKSELTVPGITQTVILTRMAGRTPMPEAERITSLAIHGCTMVIFLSAGMLPQLQEALLAGAYTSRTPAAIVYKATWPEERIVKTSLGSLAREGERNGITKTALVLVGDFLGGEGERSRLYDPEFTTGFREGTT